LRFVPSSWLRPPPLDAALAAALVVAGLIEAAVVDSAKPLAERALVTAVVMGALAWRRRFPLAVLVLALAGTFVLDPQGESVLFVAMLIASYTTGSSLPGRRSLAGLLVAVAPLWLALLTESAEPVDLVAVAVLYGGAWMVGRLVRERGRRTVELEERAARLEREQAEQRVAALADERARIARELHDIVSHSISVIAVQTQAVRRRLRPDQEREAEELRAVETTARQAMAEMRRLFGVLRSNTERPPLAPQPGLDQLPRLLERTRAAGLPVDLRVDGERTPLPPGVDLAAYRILQEALTNALKHAGQANVTVALHYGARELEVRIDDDGRGPTANGSGQGLIGMRERVALYGGSFDARPRPGGGFHVRATLPLREGGKS
jgi:signal transduction histidine kinase